MSYVVQDRYSLDDDAIKCLCKCIFGTISKLFLPDHCTGRILDLFIYMFLVIYSNLNMVP